VAVQEHGGDNIQASEVAEAAGLLMCTKNIMDGSGMIVRVTS
jgi:hypothetical protein